MLRNFTRVTWISTLLAAFMFSSCVEIQRAQRPQSTSSPQENVTKPQGPQVYPENTEFLFISSPRVTAHVDSSYWTDQPFGYGTKPKAHYLVVNLTFTNRGMYPVTFDQYHYIATFGIINDAGVGYTFQGDLSGREFTDLNPNVPGDFRMVFDVPYGNYTLIVGGDVYDAMSSRTNYYRHTEICRLRLTPKNH